MSLERRTPILGLPLGEESELGPNRVRKTTLDFMRTTYFRLIRDLSEPGISGERAKSLKDLFYAVISFTEEADKRTCNILGEIPGIESIDPTQLEVHVRAYNLLAKEENPDNWLSGFLEENPEFTDDIGGWPEWLPRSSDK